MQVSGSDAIYVSFSSVAPNFTALVNSFYLIFVFG